MIDQLLKPFESILDWLFETLLSPLVLAIGHGLEMIFLKPMDLLHIPIAVQLIVIASITAKLSMILRRKCKVDEKEELFRKKFSELKMGQQPIDSLDDWKARDVLYRSSDNMIDDEFNIYLAQRFSRQMQVYLLPIFVVLFWLESVLPAKAITLWGNGINGVQSIPVSLFFLTAYVAALITFNVIHKRTKAKEESSNGKYQENNDGNNIGAGRRFGFRRTDQKGPRAAIS